MIDVLKKIRLGLERGRLPNTESVERMFLEATEGMEDRGWALTTNDGVAHLQDYVEFKTGDIVKVDSWFKHEGLWYDAAISQKFNVSPSPLIVYTTIKALTAGVSKAKVGNKLSDISKAIEAEVNKYPEFSIIKELSGHFIGEELHMKPRVMNFYDEAAKDLVLEPGMRLAIEPLLMMTGDEFDVNTWRTKKGGLSTHYEATVEVGKSSGRVLYSGLPLI